MNDIPDAIADLIADSPVALGPRAADQTVRLVSQVMDQQEAADYLGLSTSTLERWREAKIGPAYCVVTAGPKGKRIIRYRKIDIDEWLNTRRVETEDSNALREERVLLHERELHDQGDGRENVPRQSPEADQQEEEGR